MSQSFRNRGGRRLTFASVLVSALVSGLVLLSQETCLVSEAWVHGLAEAQETLQQKPRPPLMQGAGGLSLGVVNRRDYGEGHSTRILVEPVFHLYFALPPDQLFVRTSLHFGYLWQQPEMPRAVRVEERDLYGGVGVGLLWDWIVIPSLSLGPQLVHRQTQLKTSTPVRVAQDPISRSEQLLGWFVQAGVGVPLLKGLLVFEPFYRYRWFADDARESWGYGLETSVQIF